MSASCTVQSDGDQSKAAEPPAVPSANVKPLGEMVDFLAGSLARQQKSSRKSDSFTREVLTHFNSEKQQTDSMEPMSNLGSDSSSADQDGVRAPVVSFNHDSVVQETPAAANSGADADSSVLMENAFSTVLGKVISASFGTRDSDSVRALVNEYLSQSDPMGPIEAKLDRQMLLSDQIIGLLTMRGVQLLASESHDVALRYFAMAARFMNEFRQHALARNTRRVAVLTTATVVSTAPAPTEVAPPPRSMAGQATSTKKGTRRPQ